MDEERAYMAKIPYANAISNLMYAMVCMRPDILPAVSVDESLGQYAVGYCDSDYASDLDKRRSTTDYLFTFATASVNWKSTL
ncbi:secreted RxLR effector protein 161-like [Coffea arabica]|uniref:Secreted RxLR effector protein 161-like n=1 Tax=Coffea arabica TaxID=13443 RepID=A0ABM4V2Z4_COFAR